MGRPFKTKPYAISDRDPEIVQARHEATVRRRVVTGWFTRFANAVARVLGAKKKEDRE
jgi:hypothetical protein